MVGSYEFLCSHLNFALIVCQYVFIVTWFTGILKTARLRLNSRGDHSKLNTVPAVASRVCLHSSAMQRIRRLPRWREEKNGPTVLCYYSHTPNSNRFP